MVILKTRTGMIPANETEISFTDPLINDDSIIEVYFDNDDVYALETWQNGTTVHIITNDHEGAVGIKIFINNVSSFAPYDDADIRERVAQTEQDIINLETTVDELETTVDELETTVDGLNASNINYDEHSTLYSAMGDIDSLETASKNLVGAINEVKEESGGAEVVETLTITRTGTQYYTGTQAHMIARKYGKLVVLHLEVLVQNPYTSNFYEVAKISGIKPVASQSDNILSFDGTSALGTNIAVSGNDCSIKFIRGKAGESHRGNVVFFVE